MAILEAMENHVRYRYAKSQQDQIIVGIGRRATKTISHSTSYGHRFGYENNFLLSLNTSAIMATKT